MAAFQKLCREKGLALVEDCAEALASKNAAGYLGTQSDAGCFSFAPTKVITSGQGGFILTRRQEMRDNVVRLKDHGTAVAVERRAPGHRLQFQGHRSSGRAGDVAVEEAGEAHRARPAKWMRAILPGSRSSPELKFPERPRHGGYLMWPDFKMERRDELVKHLLDHGITPRPFWPALHMQPAYASNEAYPGATDATRHACWLPCSPAITNEQIDRVIQTIRAFLQEMSDSKTPTQPQRIAIFSRYNLAEQYDLAAEFEGMLKDLAGRSPVLHLSLRGHPRNARTSRQTSRVEELPLRIDRHSPRDILSSRS